MNIKICGMREHENISEVAGLRPEYMGFIFYPASKRYVGDEFVMPAGLGIIKKAGVFVNAGYDEIARKIDRHGLNAVQLHGDENPGLCSRLQQQGTEVIKAFGVDAGFDFNRTEEYLGAVSLFLFDTRTPGYGGSGKPFDHALLEKYPWDKPYFISGGINPANVEQAAAWPDKRLYGLDLNSGFEQKPGEKNSATLSKAIAGIRFGFNKN